MYGLMNEQNEQNEHEQEDKHIYHEEVNITFTQDFSSRLCGLRVSLLTVEFPRCNSAASHCSVFVARRIALQYPTACCTLESEKLTSSSIMKFTSLSPCCTPHSFCTSTTHLAH